MLPFTVNLVTWVRSAYCLTGPFYSAQTLRALAATPVAKSLVCTAAQAADPKFFDVARVYTLAPLTCVRAGECGKTHSLFRLEDLNGLRIIGADGFEPVPPNRWGQVQEWAARATRAALAAADHEAVIRANARVLGCEPESAAVAAAVVRRLANSRPPRGVALAAMVAASAWLASHDRFAARVAPEGLLYGAARKALVKAGLQEIL